MNSFNDRTKLFHNFKELSLEEKCGVFQEMYKEAWIVRKVRCMYVPPDLLLFIINTFTNETNLKIKLIIVSIFEVYMSQVEFVKYLSKNENFIECLLKNLDLVTFNFYDNEEAIVMLFYRKLLTLLIKLANFSLNSCKNLHEKGILYFVIKIMNPLFSPFYSKSGREDLVKLTRNVSLCGEWNHFPTQDVLDCYISLPFDPMHLPFDGKGFSVDLYDNVRKINIQKEMLTLGHVCKYQEIIQDLSNVTHSEELKSPCTDVSVTNVISSHLFWANIGNDSKEILIKISEDIKEHVGIQINYLETLPLCGTLINAFHSDYGYFRAHILQSNPNDAFIFAIDFGITLSVSWDQLFQVEESSSEQIPAQAIMCRLDGVLPLPKDPQFIEQSLNLLIALTKYPTLSNRFMKKQLLSLLNKLTVVMNVLVLEKIMQILSNISLSDKKDKMVECGSISMVVTILKSFFCDFETHVKENLKDLIKCGLSVILNLLNGSSKNKLLMSNDSELIFLIFTIFSAFDDIDIVQLVLRIFRNFCFSKDLELLSKSDINIEPNFKVNSVNSVKFVSENITDCSTITTNDQHCGATTTYKQHCDTTTINDQHVVMDEGHIYPEENVAIFGSKNHFQSGVGKNSKYYSWGTKIDVVSDETHELMHRVVMTNIISFALSFLNSGLNACIYIGIDRNCLIHGITMSRDCMDSFSLQFDNDMDGVFPVVTNHVYKVSFIPVKIESTSFSDESRYVIEIALLPQLDNCYISSDNQFWIRKDAQSLAISIPDQHAFIVKKKSSIMIAELATLRSQIKNLTEN